MFRHLHRNYRNSSQRRNARRNFPFGTALPQGHQDVDLQPDVHRLGSLPLGRFNLLGEGGIHRLHRGFRGTQESVLASGKRESVVRIPGQLERKSGDHRVGKVPQDRTLVVQPSQLQNLDDQVDDRVCVVDRTSCGHSPGKLHRACGRRNLRSTGFLVEQVVGEFVQIVCLPDVLCYSDHRHDDVLLENHPDIEKSRSSETRKFEFYVAPDPILSKTSECLNLNFDELGWSNMRR